MDGMGTALRWERAAGDEWHGMCGEAWAAEVTPRAGVWGGAWRWRLVAPGSVSGLRAEGLGNSRERAQERAEAAFRAWCERAGLVAREGIVPGYKSAAVADPEGRRSAERRDAEGHVGEDAP